MITSHKCNCCIHKPVCSIKSDYLKIVESVEDALRFSEDKASVEIRCPHMQATPVGFIKRQVRPEDER